MKKILLLVITLVLLANTSFIFAEDEKPIQIGLVNPVQIHNEETSITGLKLNLLHSTNQDVKGLDWGFFSSVKGNFTGIQGNMANFTKGDALGLQTAFYSSANKMTGLQVGWFNKVTTLNGLQFGLVNIAKEANGIQLGFLNFNGTGFLPVFPIINFSLNK